MTTPKSVRVWNYLMYGNSKAHNPREWFTETRKTFGVKNFKTLYLFLIFMLIMSIADLVTTHIGLNAGFVERNPFMVFLRTYSELVAIIVTVAGITLLTSAMIYLRQIFILFVFAALYLLVVSSNFFLLVFNR